MRTVPRTPAGTADATAARRVSVAGRGVLARAVSIDWDWNLRFSSEDKMIDAVADLADEDLAGAYLLAHYLREAIACLEIHRRTEQLPPPVQRGTGQCQAAPADDLDQAATGMAAAGEAGEISRGRR